MKGTITAADTILPPPHRSTDLQASDRLPRSTFPTADGVTGSRQPYNYDSGLLYAFAMTAAEVAHSPSIKTAPSLEDPFASPVPRAVDTPTFPKPCAQLPQRSPRESANMEASAANGMQSTARDRVDSTAHKSASFSSTGHSSTMTGISSIDLEKGSLAKEQDRQSRKSRTASQRDPEKASYNSRSPASNRSPRHSHHQRSRDDVASITYSDNESEVDEGLATQEANALKILFFLSGPVVALSFLNFVWTIISLIIVTLSQPVRLCARRLTFGQQLASLLGPALNLQLKSIYTPLPPFANEDGVFHTGMLVMVHLASPLLSLGVIICAWTVAAYWAMAGIVGDPAGMDKRDDGRETVLGLRRWWENLMLKGINLD